ncbi:MAG: MerR family Zn(II)-responsive transcriptional regulator of zntA [Candidatus Azotimanducaceae bacterium]|jgi:MerR family Zn(II)-responsive transcriptional regulator of zntA
MSTLRIGELAELTQTNNETLRFYETKGLLPVPRRSPSGYRLYGQAAVDQVSFILRAKRVGFSLKEIAELLSLKVDKSDTTCGEVKAVAEHKLEVIQSKLDELHRMQAALRQITDACCGGDVSAESCSILHALESERVA